MIGFIVLTLRGDGRLAHLERDRSAARPHRVRRRQIFFRGIHHACAPASSVSAHPIAVIEGTLGTALMTKTRTAHDLTPCRKAAVVAAIDLRTIAPVANMKYLPALGAPPPSKHCVLPHPAPSTSPFAENLAECFPIRDPAIVGTPPIEAPVVKTGASLFLGADLYPTHLAPNKLGIRG